MDSLSGRKPVSNGHLKVALSSLVERNYVDGSYFSPFTPFPTVESFETFEHLSSLPAGRSLAARTDSIALASGCAGPIIRKFRRLTWS